MARQGDFLLSQIAMETMDGFGISFSGFGLNCELSQRPELGSSGFPFCFTSSFQVRFHFRAHFQRKGPLKGASAGFRAVCTYAHTATFWERRSKALILATVLLSLRLLVRPRVSVCRHTKESVRCIKRCLCAPCLASRHLRAHKTARISKLLMCSRLHFPAPSTHCAPYPEI